ncbi:MAG: fasciclin domain-containing protein [Micropruina sp.]|nr:fasciclin domain-containing protein [Micropruina sp.]
MNTFRKLGPIALLSLLPFTVVSCSAGMASAPAPSSAMTQPASMEATPPAAVPMDSPFGAACSVVPADGSGSFAGMAKDPVATAASNNPVLSTLVTAVTKAGLGETLNSAKDITVFAPTNDAFGKLPKADLDAVLADKKLLTTVLTHHVVGSRLTPAMLAGTHKTLAGTEITVKGAGEAFTVADAKVVCGNVQTANATVYIIDSVLLPPQ